ncbi:PREDICTED: crocetin glucosyltransferase 3 [Fragaria vesca subsp. vesca]|uniref:crocetin glucosyltransferase 3 n=1 Tax=Fragaria vesca subsp. vesca TaxID=101020 RepID=UPI0002C3015E|nr:PREDICTED: crocetin glucosyltransferase 3 [Fragaria vesca subsp. vesca]XP_011462588.1 PREDICTED: crocetin glucosyltransferase 3 [Fragaria vesca subsp. vesca]
MGSDKEQHIVMLPFLAQGHLIPFLALAKKIQHRTGFTITIATTPLNAQYLRSAQTNTNIHLFELPFHSQDYGLPPNTENTENLPFNVIGDFFTSSQQLEAPTRRLVSDITAKEGKPPLCLISDLFFGWAVNVAKSSGTVNIAFSTGGAYGTAAYISLWQHLPHRTVSSDDEEFHLPGFPERCRLTPSHLHQFLRAADGTDTWSRYFQPQISLSMKSFGLICNTVEEIEPFGLQVLRNYVKLPVWSVLASNISSKKYSGKKSGISAERCIEWLDSHASDSVVYISFGSQNTITASQMMELAKGLEMSKKPFVWVIRPPVGHDLKGEFRPEWLPERFEERMNETRQGLLVHNWAPQLDILAHKMTRAFVSHCGWNSVVESLSRGVPIIGWPLAAEQAYNSKMLVEEMGVSVELTRGAKSNVVAEEVRRVIELVVDESGEGGEMRRRAGEIMEKIRGAAGEDGEAKGSSVKAIDDFVSQLLSQREGLKMQ